MANTTGIAVGCAIGVPTFVALCIAYFFFRKSRKRIEQEDLELQKDDDIRDMDQDLSYDNMDQLKAAQGVQAPSEDSDQDKSGSADTDTSPAGDSKKQQRYIPAYRKQMKSAINSLGNSRSSSLSNLNPPSGQGGSHMGSNSSINSNSNSINTDTFYSNVPVLESEQKDHLSRRNSMELARSLHATPSYKIPQMARTASASSMENDEYDLKNNYNVDNHHEIQEEDQYENEFTNYSESKRAFIDGLRPKGRDV